MTGWRAHAQTLTAALPLARPALRGAREETAEVPLPGGGALVVRCAFQPASLGARPAVVVLHGVSGSSEDPYVVRTARALARQGFHVARLNQRGSGLGMGRSPHLAHAALAEDLELTARMLAARSDVSSVGALGFSLGGHVALTLAADIAGDRERLPALRAVASISAPIDLHESSRSFDALRARPLAGLYERLIVRSLAERARALPGAPFPADVLARLDSIRAFDAAVTVPTHGFVDVDDYYTRASVAPRLARIALPTLAIHAEDDPMVPVHALRRAFDAADRSAAFDVVIVPTGGHVGFVESIAHLWDATSAVARAIDHLRRNLS